MFELGSLYFDFLRTWRTLPVVHWVRAARLHRAGLHDAAIPLYERGLDRHPVHPAAYYARLDLAHCLRRVHRFDDAESHLRLLMLGKPDCRTATIRLIKLKMWQGLFHEAGMLASRAAQRHSPDAELVGLALWCLLRSKSNQALMRDVLALEQQLPPRERQGNALIHGMLGWYNLSMGDKVLGVRELARVASTSGRQSVEVLLAYAETLIERGQIAAAREELMRALTLRPSYPLTMALLAKCYLHPDHYSPLFASQQAVQACRASGWRCAFSLHLYADAQYRLGEFSTAMAAAQRARREAQRIVSRYAELPALEELISDLDARTA